MPIVFASHTTFLNFSGALPKKILNGDTIRVNKIFVANTSGADAVVSVQHADDSSVFMELPQAANSSLLHEVEFIADRGIQFNINAGHPDKANVSITVFHGHSGS